MINYQLETDRIIKSILENNSGNTLLLHCCCAPCSSYVLEYLTQFFEITVYFYNPNITEDAEYAKRKNELIRFIDEYTFSRSVKMIDADYDPERFLEICRGREELEEGRERCFDCYALRLESTAVTAQKNAFDYFCTTLSVSPHKNSAKLNEIGEKLSSQYCVKYLFSDFKKRNGYTRSIELSSRFNLYRQNYCGCIYSKMQALKKENNKNISNI